MPVRTAVPLIARRKNALRKAIKLRLAEQPAATARQRAKQVTERVLEIPEVAHADGVLVCLSFGHEIDTWGLVDRLRETGRTVYVPRATTQRRLHVHRYPCRLETLSFGLRQPLPDTPEVPDAQLADQIDVALIVGLAFDRQGFRLGYGGGYFDRFLVDRPFPALGLAFHLQMVEALPAAPHDIPMRAVITEAGVWRPESTEGS